MTINLGQRQFAWRTAAVGALLIALIAGLVGWFQPHSAQAVLSDATVSIDFTPTDNDHQTVGQIDGTVIDVEVDDLIPVDIVIKSATNITSFNFGIEFDNTIFSVDTASFRAISDGGTFFFLTGGTAFGSPVNAVSQFPAVVATSGNVSVVTLTGITLPLVNVVATEGLLARITFTAKKEATAASIKLVTQPTTGDFLSDGTADTSTPTLNEGAVTVVSQTTPPIAEADTVVAKQAATGATTITTIDLLANDTAGSSGSKALGTIEDVVTSSTTGAVNVATDKKTVEFVSTSGFEGTTTFTYRIQTADGTSANAALVTVIIDGTAPTVTAPPDITVVQDTVEDTGNNIPNGASMSAQAFGGRELIGQTLAAFIGAGMATDGNGSGVDTNGVVVTFSDANGAVTPTQGVFDIGTTPGTTVITATFTATDEAGNEGTATSTITILVADGDQDGDQFNNDVEAFIGTDFLEPCRTSTDTQNPDPEADDRFPADTSGDGKVTLTDLGTFAAAFGGDAAVANSGYLRRVDYSMNDKIDLADLGFFAASFNLVCDPSN